MTKKTRLELTWPGKENRPALEPRILIEHPEMSYHAAERRKGDRFDNLLIKGDNLLALKALEADYAGRVKCVFIDPPYNTGSAFTHYDDGLEHSLWLSLMRDRLECIHRLLADDGSLWVTLDDNEAHYFKVMADEVFGRKNFIIDVCWQKRDGPPNDRKIGSISDHILVWSKSSDLLGKKTKAEESFNLMARTEKADAQYQVFAEPDGPDERGPFRKIDTTANGKGGRFVQSLYYGIVNPYTGEEVWPRDGTCWRHKKEEMERLQSESRLFWGAKGTARTPMRKLFKTEAKQGMSAPSIWADVGLNQHASSEMEGLFGQKAAFETPKPEFLLNRIIHIATNPDDLVLDSFAGSGTTGAVAHKMGRRWIMIEIGEHAETHIVPRLKKVIDGKDQGGVSKAVDWKGGGGFRYLTLAPSLLAKDAWGNWVIDKVYNPEMLAEAMCKHLGFDYAPSQEEGEWWRHGQSSESDFLYVTTQSLTHEALKLLSEAVGSDRTLLVCARAFAGQVDQFPNLMAKKIPSTILSSCEWGKDDYSLSVVNLPQAQEATPDFGPLFANEEAADA
ncbi:site-specific DNA-methyltransferase [Novosphingobium sp. G106]|uniref:site-specific DNA-methyltransferase n=1 Tax=Novosphingobium sp. G106 TaxID=2849500 RepID=UPI001C2D690D|nr:site-specific DNA-methyltransferase [Novosphingobium sp. G106]MBV1692051.1 site-specific DNA-methyltransferase [Novosphingobium sp. G106]